MLKILKTKSGKRYGYDGLTGKIITIRQVGNEKDFNTSDEELIRQIHEKSIADDKKISKVKWLFPFDEYVRQLQHEIPGMVLSMTDLCNLKCSYCSVSGGARKIQKNPIHMSEEILKKSLDFFIEHNTDSATSHIGFYGGESLLRFPLIKKSVEYMNRCISNKVPTFDISTNGLMLTDGVAEWLSEHSEVQVTCTVNGLNHDKYRKKPDGSGSLSIILRNLLNIRERYPSVWNEQMRFIANIDTDEEIPELLEFYDENLGMLPGLVSKIMWDVDCKLQHENCTESILIDFEKPSPVRDYYVHLLSPVKRRKRSKSSDDAVIGSCFPCRVKMFVMTDGRISFCEQVNDHFSIGSVEKGFDFQTLKDLYDNGEKLFSNKCIDCWAQKMCDICFSALIDSEGNLLPEIPNEFCLKSRRTAERKLQLFCQLSEEAPDLIDEI